MNVEITLSGFPSEQPTPRIKIFIECTVIYLELSCTVNILLDNVLRVANNNKFFGNLDILNFRLK